MHFKYNKDKNQIILYDFIRGQEMAIKRNDSFFIANTCFLRDFKNEVFELIEFLN